MKSQIFYKIELPEGVSAQMSEDYIVIKGPEGINKKKLDLYNIDLKIEKNQILIECKKATKKEKRKINTIRAHIKNMIKGVLKKFEYQVKICYSHFPINVSINNNVVTIKNFLGEKAPRKMKIPEGIEIEIKGDIIIIKSCDKELAGQTAANLEAVCRISNRDRRIFQDGLYIINKNGREI